MATRIMAEAIFLKEVPLNHQAMIFSKLLATLITVLIMEIEVLIVVILIEDWILEISIMKWITGD